ncbi:Os1348 family NHLP clan protein [Silvibacterium sp.]|uniref:Os1348 family NHLP clan protein n=1 Tax=Silvibacterium sp. TaxID=1964179 RepID=UPI0039E225F3
MSQFDELYHKVLTDAQFRKELVEHPHRALESLGITPTPEILAAIKQIEQAVVQLEGDLQGTIQKVQVT